MTRETIPGRHFTEHTSFASAKNPPAGFSHFRRVSAFGADTDVLAFKTSATATEIQIPISRIDAIQNLGNFIYEITTNTTCTHVYTVV